MKYVIQLEIQMEWMNTVIEIYHLHYLSLSKCNCRLNSCLFCCNAPSSFNWAWKISLRGWLQWMGTGDGFICCWRRNGVSAQQLALLLGLLANWLIIW